MELKERVYVIQPNYCTTQELPRFITGIGKQQAQKYVDQMYEHPDFHKDVVKPTQRTTVVNIERFFEFMKVMENERL